MKCNTTLLGKPMNGVTQNGQKVEFLIKFCLTLTPFVGKVSHPRQARGSPSQCAAAPLRPLLSKARTT